MKKLIFALFLVFALTGCSSKGVDSTLGDGKVDETEAALVRLIVGATLSNNPEIVIPVELVSGELLVFLSDDTDATVLSLLDITLAEKVEDLEMDPMTKASFNEFVSLVKSRMSVHLNPEMSDSDRVVVVRDILDIVNQAAKARSGGV